MAAKPYYTSADIIEAIKRKVSFPTSQTTFTDNDLLKFVNDEVFASQVPSILEYHEEYFVYRKITPLLPYTSRYAIPNRAIGMRLRDVFWSDPLGNYFEMTRINADDKAYFQRNIGSNMAIHKFYLENNEVVLTPSIIGTPTGDLNFFIFLRPNQLVDVTRAAIMKSFSRSFSFNNSFITIGDNVHIITGQFNPMVTDIPFIFSQNTIASTTAGSPTIVTTTLPHGQVPGSTFKVYITEVAGTTPALNAAYTATSTGASTFTIPVVTVGAGTGGNYALANHVSIGSTSIQTANNFCITLNDQGGGLVTGVYDSITGVITITSFDITTEVKFNMTNTTQAYTYDASVFTINFDQLPGTYQDPLTGTIETLYVGGSKIDLLQTLPGHRTFNYDVVIQSITGNSAVFKTADFQFLNSTGFNTIQVYYNIVVGDYICLANECIIPQIPPDLHNILAERTCARILSAIGDMQGVGEIRQRISEVDKSQGIMLDQRVEGSPQKITARHSLLRTSKIGSRRRL